MTNLPSGHNLNLEPDLLAKYEAELTRLHAGSTTKRKLSSLRKFLNWAGEKPRETVIPPQTPQEAQYSPPATQQAEAPPSGKGSSFSKGDLALITMSLLVGITGGGIYAGAGDDLWGLYEQRIPQQVLGISTEREAPKAKTFGSDFIAEGNIGVKIYSEQVNQNSTIYINAPRGAGNINLFVKEIRDGVYFVVETEQPAAENVGFEWLIKNKD